MSDIQVYSEDILREAVERQVDKNIELRSEQGQVIDPKYRETAIKNLLEDYKKNPQEIDNFDMYQQVKEERFKDMLEKGSKNQTQESGIAPQAGLPKIQQATSVGIG